MIQEQTKVKVTDNTGAKIAQCFRILGGTRKRYAQIGDIIVCAVKKAEPRRTVKKHDKVRGLVVRQKRKFKRADGTYISFSDNAIVIIDDKGKPKGGRIFGPLPREIKEKGYGQVANLAKEIV